MKHFNKRYFVDENGNRLQHSANKPHAKYGTVGSTSEEKGTDGKKNNTSEYNHKYYTENTDKWKDNKKSSKRSSNDSLYYDKDGKARFGHKLYDPNDPDFKRTDGELIPGTNLRVFTNQNGSLIVMGDGVKFSYPPGTQLTSEMKNEIAGIEKKKSSLNSEQYVAKMHNAVTKFADNQGLDTDIAGTDKAKKKKSSSKKKSSGTKKSSSKKNTKANTEVKAATEEVKKKVDGNAAFNREYDKLKKTKKSNTNKFTKTNTASHSDIGSTLIKDIF